MKIFFVGMHNKPGLKPLCSSTKTGKIIDAVIIRLDCECVKTNLCDTDYIPDNVPYHAQAWHCRFVPEPEDYIVLLGHWVQQNFVKSQGIIIKVPHPASILGASNVQKYLDQILENFPSQNIIYSPQ